MRAMAVASFLPQHLIISISLLSSSGNGLCQFNLVSVGHINDGGVAGGVAVSGKYVYLANQSDGLRIYEVSDPTNPVNIAHTNNPGPAEDVVVVGNYAYLANAGDGLRIYDVSNPTNPISVGEVSYGLASGSAPLGLLVTNDSAYVAAGNAMQVFGVSNPAAPYFSNATTLNLSQVYGVGVWGTNVYVTDGSTGMYVYNLNDLFTPVAHVTSGGTIGYATWVTVAGDLALLANGGDGLRIYNVTNPAVPVNVGHAITGSFADWVVVVGNYAYIAQSTGIQVYDISNPSQPILAGSGGTAAAAFALAVSGDYIYVASSKDGLRIFRMIPQLRLAKLLGTNAITLSWPLTVAQFSLEQCPDLATTNWTAVTNTPITQGQQNQMTLSISPGNQFYRLRPNGN